MYIHAQIRLRKRRAARLENALSTAQRIVAREGLDGLTLARLAEELAVSTPALYRYFDSKDALVAALQRRMIASLHARFQMEVLGPMSEDGDERERALVRLLDAGAFYLSLPERLPNEYRLLAHLLGDPRLLVGDSELPASVALVSAFLAEVAALFSHAEQVGVLAPGSAVERALCLWGALHGIAQLGKLARVDAHHFDAPRLGAQALDALLIGWGARESILTQARARRASRQMPEPKTERRTQ